MSVSSVFIKSLAIPSDVRINPYVGGCLLQREKAGDRHLSIRSSALRIGRTVVKCIKLCGFSDGRAAICSDEVEYRVSHRCFFVELQVLLF